MQLKLGYYTTLLGLGTQPDDVTLHGQIMIHEGRRIFWLTITEAEMYHRWVTNPHVLNLSLKIIP